MEAELVAAKFEMDELYFKITSSMQTPGPSTSDTRDPRGVLDHGKSNLGRRLAVRLLVGGDVDTNPKTLAATAAANAAFKSRGKALVPDIDIPANVQRVSRPPVGSSRLSAVTSAASAADAQNDSGAGPSKPAPALEAAPAARGVRHPQHAVVARKHRSTKPTASSIFRVSSVAAPVSTPLEPTSSIESSSSLQCEKPSQDDPMDEFFAIMEQFVEEPGEMEYLRAAEAARRSRKGVSADADGSKPAGGGGTRSKEFARQNSQKKEFARQNSQKVEFARQPTLTHPCLNESPPAAPQTPGTRPQHRHQRQKSFAGGFPAEQNRASGGPGSSPVHSGGFELNPALQSHQRAASTSPSPPPQQHHHMRRHSRAGDMLESAPSLSMREPSVASSRPSHVCMARERSRSFTDRITTLEPEQARLNAAAAAAAATISRSESFGVGAASVSREPPREVQAYEASQQRELESLVDALKAEIRAKDQLLEASENERKLLEEELRGAWEHVADMERQLEGMQAAGAAMEREMDALRAQAGGKRAFGQRRGGSEGDMAVGNHILEMERALGELTRKLAAKENALQRSEAQKAELTGKMANRENELGRTKSALQQAELERDSLAEEMEAALASWAADSPQIPTPGSAPSPGVGESQNQVAANLASALEAAQRELLLVRSERDSLLMVVGQPRRQEHRSPHGSANRTPNRSLTPSPVHSRGPSISSSSRSGPMELQRDLGMEAPQMVAQQRSRHVRFSPHPTDLQVPAN